MVFESINQQEESPKNKDLRGLREESVPSGTEQAVGTEKRVWGIPKTNCGSLLKAAHEWGAASLRRVAHREEGTGERGPPSLSVCTHGQPCW